VVTVPTFATSADATSAVATGDGDDSVGEYDASATAGAPIGTTATTPMHSSRIPFAYRLSTTSRSTRPAVLHRYKYSLS
jgi:hypothetical protein